MSEVDKIIEKYQKKHQRLERNLQIKFYTEIGKLQIECKHEKTHWMQELTKEGKLKNGLFKRCLICGSTIDTLENEVASEECLTIFDKKADELKLQSPVIDNVTENSQK